MGQVVESVPFQLRIVVVIQVVDSIDGVALLQPVAAEVIADETGRAGDKDLGGGVECLGECHGGCIPSSLPSASVFAEQVAGIDLVRDIAQIVGHAVGDDDVGNGLEFGEVADDARMVELILEQIGLVDDDFDAFGLDPLHDALDRGLAEIVGSSLHRQAENADDLGFAADNHVGHVVFAGTVGIDDRSHDVVRDIGVVGQELLGVLGQAVATVAK